MKKKSMSILLIFLIMMMTCNGNVFAAEVKKEEKQKVKTESKVKAKKDEKQKKNEKVKKVKKPVFLPKKKIGPIMTVKLKNFLGNKEEISFTVSNTYEIIGTTVEIQKGKTYLLLKNGSKLVLLENGKKLHEGKNILFSPKAENPSYIMTIRDNMYMGDMNFASEGSYIRPYNTLTLDNYLKGVVPREMSNDWGYNKGLEALKAQAVTARTFAQQYIGKVISDTQEHQVYGGFHPNYSFSNTAVDTTKNQILTYEEKPSDTFYSASNGGYILSKVNAWGNHIDNVPYLTGKKDPFDIIAGEKGEAKQFYDWTFTLEKEQIVLTEKERKKPKSWWNKKKEVGNEKVVQDLKKRIAKKEKLSQDKYDIKISRILSFQATTPETVKGDDDVLTTIIQIEYMLQDKKSGKFVMEKGEIKPIAVELSDNTYDYFMNQSFGEKTMYAPQILHVKETKKEYQVTGSGFGHGIGMSQYGAYEMAKLDYNYQDILAFYYPNTQIFDGKSYQTHLFQFKETKNENNLASVNVTYGDNLLSLDVETQKKGAFTVSLIGKDGKEEFLIKNDEKEKGTTHYEWSNSKWSGSYRIKVKHATDIQEIAIHEQKITMKKDPVLVSPHVTVDDHHINLGYHLKQNGKVVAELQDEKGNRVFLIEPFLMKTTGSYHISKELPKIKGTYRIHISLWNEKGEVLDTYQQNINVQNQVQAFHKIK